MAAHSHLRKEDVRPWYENDEGRLAFYSPACEITRRWNAAPDADDECHILMDGPSQDIRRHAGSAHASSWHRPWN